MGDRVTGKQKEPDGANAHERLFPYAYLSIVLNHGMNLDTFFL